MIDILLVPIALVIVLVMMHSWFGEKILEKGIIFTDLAIAQFASTRFIYKYWIFS